MLKVIFQVWNAQIMSNAEHVSHCSAFSIKAHRNGVNTNRIGMWQLGSKFTKLHEANLKKINFKGLLFIKWVIFLQFDSILKISSFKGLKLLKSYKILFTSNVCRWLSLRMVKNVKRLMLMGWQQKRSAFQLDSSL